MNQKSTQYFIDEVVLHGTASIGREELEAEIQSALRGIRPGTRARRGTAPSAEAIADRIARHLRAERPE